jgi:hypothetical protein
VTVSSTWASLCTLLRFRDFLTHNDIVSKRNPEITVPIHMLRMSKLVGSLVALIPFCDLKDLDSN